MAKKYTADDFQEVLTPSVETDDFKNTISSENVDLNPQDIYIAPKEEVKIMSDNIISYTTICVNFKDPVMQIDFEVQATGEKLKITAVNKELKLYHGKTYFIPVDNINIDTDDFKNIKMFSDMSKLLDVRYIKKGVACILPLRHNVSISDGQRLAIVW